MEIIAEAGLYNFVASWRVAYDGPAARITIIENTAINDQKHSSEMRLMYTAQI